RTARPPGRRGRPGPAGGPPALPAAGGGRGRGRRLWRVALASAPVAVARQAAGRRRARAITPIAHHRSEWPVASCPARENSPGRNRALNARACGERYLPLRTTTP